MLVLPLYRVGERFEFEFGINSEEEVWKSNAYIIARES